MPIPKTTTTTTNNNVYYHKTYISHYIYISSERMNKLELMIRYIRQLAEMNLSVTRVSEKNASASS